MEKMTEEVFRRRVKKAEEQMEAPPKDLPKIIKRENRNQRIKNSLVGVGIGLLLIFLGLAIARFMTIVTFR